MLSGKCKLKQQWNSTTHLSEWPKSGTLTIPNVTKDVEQQELSSITGGNTNGTAILEDSLVVSDKTKHTLNIQSNKYTPWYLSKWAENLCPHKNLHIDI